MSVEKEEECIRGVWEGRCAVKGCGRIKRLEGPWRQIPQFQACFHGMSGRNGEMEDGWWYFQRGYLAWGDSDKVHYRSMLLCSEHAKAWLDYCDEMDAWSKVCREQRKNWWLTVKRIIGFGELPAKPPKPKSPFESQTAEDQK